jgi:hypothetical protein
MPSRDAARSQHAQLAALSRAAKEPSGTAMTEQARRTFRDSFDVKHECKLCGTVEIDQSLPAKERARQSEAAYRAHMTRISHRRRLTHSRELAARRDAYAAQRDADELSRLDDAV